MADHQPLPVAGYKPQSPETVELVNTNKRMEEQSLRILDALSKDTNIDKRWLALGRTHMELAWMCTNRAVFQPSRVSLPTDTNA